MEQAKHRDDVSVPIVGIGASAGGIEALEEFFAKVPEQSGLAFVVIMHLDPDHKGRMVAVLQRSTHLPVVQADDGQKVEPDRVYLIPPGKDISVERGVLRLRAQELPRGLNLPVDVFFRSLAADQKEHGTGVVLSGMGSDGTLGLRAIKENAGATFVQALDSAKFDGMPRSAIEAGLADVVAPVQELPAKIIAYRQHAPHLMRALPEPLGNKAQGTFESIFALVRAKTGNEFSLYKRSTIHRRIARRMGLHQIDNLADYVRYLREHPREIELLSRELLIGVTSFFRDAAAWEKLKNTVLPELFAIRTRETLIRAWVAGCSTGEEAYSLAIVFREALEATPAAKNLMLQIFATDLDREAIETARAGIFPANIVVDVSPERLRRFFVREERGYRVNKEIREMVVFAPQNIIMDPPFTKLDIVSCRNLLIYLAPELQRKLIPLFHYSLNPGGILFLGTAETIGTFTALFAPMDPKDRIYRRLESGLGLAPVDFPATLLSRHTAPQHDRDTQVAAVTATTPNLQMLADHVLVQRFSPAAVLCNEKGEILYISGRTGKYLEPAVGRASMNIISMARDGLRLELSGAFTAAVRADRTVNVHGITVGTNGGTQTVNLTVQKLHDPKELRGTVLVVIADTAQEVPESSKGLRVRRKSADHAQREQLHVELQRALDEVQSTREEMQTSQEELKSTNEELQSTNEELQSTNEELTTSKEELQSMNEELQTVNQELQSKLDELSRSNNDMKNLLNSTDIATLFLDNELLVRRFTSPTTSIIKLIPADIGRPITDIAKEIDYPDLAMDAREVVRTLVFKERMVTGTDNRWFSVRILPYRTIENVIEGVVITFTDASASKAMEEALRQQTSELKQLAESLTDLVLGFGVSGACDYVSPQWADHTGIPVAEHLGHGWLQALHDEDRDPVRQLWRAALNSGTVLDVEFRLRAKVGGYRWFKSRMVPIRDAQGVLMKWYASSSDIHDLKQAAVSGQEAAERLTSLLEHATDPFVLLKDGGKVSFVNAAAERAFRMRRDEVLGKSFFSALPQEDGQVFLQRCEEVARADREVSFETALSRVSDGKRFLVRIVPSFFGLAIFFQLRTAPAATAVDGGPRGSYP